MKIVYEPTNNRGNALTSLGREKEAIAAFERAIELAGTGTEDSDRIKSYNGLAIALRRTGQLEKAIAMYSRALRIDPANGEALFNRALARNLNEEYVEAIADATKYLELVGEDVDALMIRSAAHMGRHDFQKAIEDSNFAIRQAPGHLGALKLRSKAYLAIGAYSAANRDLDAVLARVSDDPESFALRALAKREKSVAMLKQKLTEIPAVNLGATLPN